MTPEEQWPYREAIRSLLWLSNMTRPDIANALREVARHSHNPEEEHWNAVLKILSYLRGTKVPGLRFTQGQGLGVSVYVDVDYAKKANDRRSVCGATVTCGVCVCWKSTTQRCVTSLNTRAEYVACGYAIKEALFVCVRF